MTPQPQRPPTGAGGSTTAMRPLRRLRGIAIAPGLGMGPARLAGSRWEARAEPGLIRRPAVQGELRRIEAAFKKTGQELDEAARRVEQQFSPALAGIFHAHELMLQSLQASSYFRDEIEHSLVDAETAVRRVFRRLQEKFLALEGEHFQQRSDDLADLGRKVLRHLAGEQAYPWRELPAGSVLVFERLLPSEVLPLNRPQVAALVVGSLGRGSHAALLARSKGLPTLAEIPDLLQQVRPGDELLVDAFKCELVINPDAATRQEFQERVERLNSTQVRCYGLCREVAHTQDGQRVRVEANVGAFDEVQLALENGADGVGLFRIEELYLRRQSPPSEEELLAELRGATLPLRDKRLTFRLLDIGGDKPVPFLALPPQANRLLGQRGVRLLLEYPQLLRTELRALLRLALEQPLRVLVPMITLEEDLQSIRQVLEQMAAELGLRQLPELGAMVETPAAALNVTALAQHADFLSVGTNDLAQYTLAAGRDDPSVNRYYQDNHVSVLRLLRMILAEAGPERVTLCGELAGREEMLPELLHMGFRCLSIAPSLIPGTKALIRNLRLPLHGTTAEAA